MGIQSINFASFKAAVGGGGGGSAPTFVAAGAISEQTSGAGNAITPVIPTHQADDILIAEIQILTPSANITTPSGWTNIMAKLTNPGGMASQWFWKRAASGSETNPAISEDVNTVKSARVYVYRGCVASGTPYEAETSTAYNGTSPSTAGITTLGANRLVVVLADKFQTTDFSAGYPPGGWTNDSSSSNAGDSGCHYYALSKSVAVAGAVSSASMGTPPGTKLYDVLTLALIPA